MDNSSRNIVNFIATITVAALILMAANYFAQTQGTPAPVAEAAPAVAAETAVLSENEIASEDNNNEESSDLPSDEYDQVVSSETEITVDKPEGISGAPSTEIREY